MGNVSRIHCVIALAATAFIGTAASAQESKTTCTESFGTVTCRTNEQPSRSQLDYAKVMQQSQDLVPKVEPQRRDAAIVPTLAPASRSTPSDPISRGRGFISSCADPDVIGIVACGFYLKGLVEGNMSAWVATKTPPQYCIPSSVSDNQLRIVLVNFIKTYPDLQLLSTAAFAHTAFEQAYPCSNIK